MNPMFEIKTLEGWSEGQLIDMFLEAFSDYATSFSKDQLRSIFKFRGFDQSLSFGAFDGNRPAAFVFNGIGTHNGVATAYDSGTGTLPDYRGKGLIQDILAFGDKYLRCHGIKQYLLEVLCDNAPAIHIYQKSGFKIKREFRCFSQNISDIRLGNITAERWKICRADADILPYIAEFTDYDPSWQNSTESLERGGDDVTYLAAYDNNRAVGVIAINPRQGDLMSLAVHPSFRNRGIGSRLFEKAVDIVETDRVKMLNVNSRCTSLITFLEHRDITPTVTQFEMTKSLI